jgi:trk system potassium uptake protein TrkH
LAVGYSGGLGSPLAHEIQAFLDAAGTPLRNVHKLEPVIRLPVLLGLAHLLGRIPLPGGTPRKEWTHAFAGLPYHERLYAAVFQAATARTAGFNVVDLALLAPASVALTSFAMFIGASPGSTGGGIKVTTVAALFAGFRGELLGRAPTLANRTLPDAVIRKAIGVTSLSLVIVGIAFVLLLLVESHPPFDLLFEAISAFSTTGLSTGITPKLSTPGKLLIVVMMYIGRIGPLTLALALASKAEQRVLRLPEERVLIG